jgi:hypothetical protein
MLLVKWIYKRYAEISLRAYKQVLVLSIALAFVLVGCSPVQNNGLTNMSHNNEDHQVIMVGNAPRLIDASLQRFDVVAFSQSISNLFSSPEIKRIANPIKPYIEELVIYVPLVESAGIKLEDIYTDLNPANPLLILEFKLESVDERKLDSIVSRSIETRQKLSGGLKLLRSTVKASKSKIGQFSIDRIQIRMGPYPPFASTRLKYSRG